MGPDPAGIVSYCEKHNIVVQAYSPLGNGELISDPQLSAIGSSITPAKSGAQVALKYVVQSGHAVCTKADNPEYLAEDIDVFSWNITKPDLAKLTAATTPKGSPSWACSS
jgi:diketogulonate reductase-like aldo/keto reductase